MYRIRQYPKGWIVEVSYVTCFLFFRRIQWRHVTHYTGLEGIPFFYRTAHDAMLGALDKIKEEISTDFFFR